jgi:Fic family protein
MMSGKQENKMLSDRKTKIIETIKERKLCTSMEIATALTETFNVSIATVKRDISDLISQNLIAKEGRGKGTRYGISPMYQLLRPIDIDIYYEKEIDERDIIDTFNWKLLRSVLGSADLFSAQELNRLNHAQDTYRKNIEELSESGFQKELERLAIDLSWKSSEIEGNTYSLLETERLLTERETASGKTKEEAIMLLNHKEAIDFLIENKNYLNPLTISRIEDIHRILIKDLNVEKNLRTRRVGISGTNYIPPDNAFQIEEAMTAVCEIVNKTDNIFTKALLVLALISYIQPFMDGNKRTARIVGNAILIGNGYCPISFRTVDSLDYKKAMLLFYEQNNLDSLKKIFIEQYEFAVKTYF